MEFILSGVLVCVFLLVKISFTLDDIKDELKKHNKIK